MMDNEGPEEKIKRLMRESSPNNKVVDFTNVARKRGRPVAQAASRVEISGSNNHVHIHFHAGATQHHG